MTVDAAYVRNLAPAAQTRLSNVHPVTPLEQVRLVGLANDVFLKREDKSKVRSYKWRGAFNMMMQMLEQKGPVPMVTASAGNHAQGVAWAANEMGLNAKIYMPVSTPDIKKDAVRFFGGDNVEVVLFGDTYNQAAEAAHHYAEASGAEYIHAFDNVHTIAGQATMAREIVASTPKDQPYDMAFLQIGGGGMASGVSSVLREAYPGIRLIGVEGEGQACMLESFNHGDIVTLPRVDVLCDGTAVTRPGELCYSICKETLDEIITVSNGDIHAAMGAMLRADGTIPEPSGVMGVAGMMRWAQSNSALVQGKRMLGVISGSNMDFEKLGTLFTAAAQDTRNNHYLRLEIGENNGSLLELADTCFSGVNITAFQYGKVDHERAWPVIGFKATDLQMSEITSCLQHSRVPFENVTGSLDAGNGLIHYDPRLFSNPLLLEVDFPERKGALRELMRAVKPYANMCYFNYKSASEVRSSAMVAFEFKSKADQAPCLAAIEKTPVTCRPVDNKVRDRMLYVSRGPV